MASRARTPLPSTCACSLRRSPPRSSPAQSSARCRAWQASRTDIASLLKDGGAAVSTRRRGRAAFAIAEVAFVAMLLVATTLVVVSFIKVTRLDLGFNRDRLVVTDFVRFPGRLDDALDALRRVPGVAAVGAMTMGSPPLILRGLGRGGSSSMDLHRPGSSDVVSAIARRVSDGYFSAAGVRLVRGSSFERATGPAVVLDELCARQLFPDRDPIGATIRLGAPRAALTAADDLTVIGVVASVRIDGPDADVEPQAYLPMVPRGGTTVPAPVINGGNVQFILRTDRAAVAVVPAIDVAIAGLAPRAPGTPAPAVAVVEEAFRKLTADRRFNAGLMMVFGALALVIGVAGLYGVLSSLVAQRSREIGVRVALGATPGRIRRDVLSQAAVYVGAGLAIGLPAGWLVSRGFASLYFGVTPADLAVYLGVAALLAGTGLAAGLLPARRASTIDPIVTLRR